MALFNPNYLTWRNQLNPLVGLTMGRLVSMFNSANMGYHGDLQWLFQFIEERDATLRGVMERRLSAIKKLDWSIKIKKGKENNPTAKKQQKHLQEIYNNIDNLQKCFEFLATASFRGFAHLEKHWDEEGRLKHLEPVPQYLWVQKLPDAHWLYNATAMQTNRGVQIDPANFMIREVARPIDKIGAVCFLRKNLSQKDWDGFIETYGIPPLFLKLPQGVGIKDEVERKKYQEIADAVISDGRGVLPFGTDLANPTANVSGMRAPFSDHLKYQDEQIVLAGTSGLLTTLNQPTGIGGTQGEAHQDAFFDLAKAEAKDITEILQKNIDEKEFEDEEILVYFELAHQEIEDGNVIDEIGKLNSAGYQVAVDQVAEMTGYDVTIKQQPGMGGGDPFGGGGEFGGGFDGQEESNGEEEDFESFFPPNSTEDESDEIGMISNRISNLLKEQDGRLLDGVKVLRNRLRGRRTRRRKV